MNELSLYILDLTQNSITAGASCVELTIVVSDEEDSIVIILKDDGCGMDAEFLARVTSPFTTTRKTRRVGLGIPMIKEQCESCDGEFNIESEVGVGTTMRMSFRKSHIDLPPMGDLADTMVTLVNGSPEKPDFVLRYVNGGEEFVFDTRQIRQILEGVALSTPDVLAWISQYVTEGIEEAGKLP